MIGKKEIIKSIATLIGNELNLKVYAIDAKEGYDRPSFFIEEAMHLVTNLGTDLMEERVTIRLTYFPEDGADKNKKLWEMEERLKKLFFVGIKITNDFFVTFEEDISFEITPSTNLAVLLPMHFIQDVAANLGEDVETLEMEFTEE
ncbi:MAG: hypothetical protein RR536_01815 [Anaerovoracaceae bacterium]